MAAVEKLGIVGVLIVFCLMIAVGIGWITNIYKFATADFKAPYKNEILRGVGIPFTPLGAVLGYVTIADGKEVAIREYERRLKKDFD
jgi:hypothetical protein